MNLFITGIMSMLVHDDQFLEDIGLFTTEEDRQKEAIRRFESGEPYCMSTFIDETTTTYGYGKLDWSGSWEFELPMYYLIEKGIIK